MSGCPTFAVDGGVADLLRVVDCETHVAVADGYARLFGTSGAFGAVLTGALTLYVAFFALRLMTGRAGLSIGVLTPRMLTIGLVLTFATSWPAYQTMVFDLLTKGPEQIATAMIGGRSGATAGFMAHLDALFIRLTEAAAEVGAGAPAAVRNAPLAPGNLLTGSAMILLIGTAGVLVIAKIILAVLLAVGPLFILLALHSATRGLFEGWLRTAGLFALAPLVTILVGSAGIAMLQPMIAALDMGATPRLAMMLFAGALVYAALLLVAFRTAVGLTASWKLPAGLAAADRAEASAHASARSAAAAPSDAASRIGSVVAAVSRDDALGPPPRAAALAALPVAANDGAAAGASPSPTPRARGLGQTFRGRAPTSRRQLSGAIGA
jgi:type IV secretion system protein VirB6